MANQYTKQKIDEDELLRLYRSGMTQAEVASEMGTTQRVVWKRLREAGEKCRPAAPRNQHGSGNNNWRGDDVGYKALHYRIKALFGSPKKCQACGTEDPTKTYDWANLTGKYEDPSDYQRMCRSCHWKLDQKHKNFERKGGVAPCL